MYVAEIFKSIHGEVNGHHQGRVVGFIRLSGCNLRCKYCDTPDTQNPCYGTQMSITDIIGRIIKLKVKYVCITGGEPLLNEEKLPTLVEILSDMDIRVSIETNGTKPIHRYFNYVESMVIDYKFEYSHRMLSTNFLALREKDVIKFVVTSKEEFNEACLLMRKFKAEGSEAVMAVSPVVSSISPEELTQLVIGAGELGVVLSLQIHKMLKLK